jgi:hypothetical protein
MLGFHHASLLDLVAQGESKPLLKRAMLLLLAARPGLDPASAWDWTVGDRDRAIWQAWRLHRGGDLEAISSCPNCRELLEFSLPENFAPPPAVSARALLKLDGGQWTLRLPTSRDLLAAQRGEFSLLDLLVEDHMKAEIPQQAIEAALDAADPGLDIVIAHKCPVCDAEARQRFDVIRFVWQDCALRAERLLQDIDFIARVYGWSEEDILKLSDQRRSRYVAMIREQSDSNIQRIHSSGRRV